MLKIVKEQLNFSKIRLFLVTALTYCLLHNSTIFAYKYSYYALVELKAFLKISKDFIYLLIFAIIIFFGLTINSNIFTFCSCLLFISIAIYSYYIFLPKIAPSKQKIKAVFNSNLAEISEIIDKNLSIYRINPKL